MIEDNKLLQRLISSRKDVQYMDYEESKKLAKDKDPEVRRKLAARDDIVPEILYFLAEDSDPKVRSEIANNPFAPRYADMLLVNDDDDEIRYNLALKIANLTPNLSTDEHDRIRNITYEILECLTHDQIPRVRRVISDTLKDVANVPSEVIRKLARDIEIAVSAPVLEFSPVLTDEDLLEIIEMNPSDGAIFAISRRVEVGEFVADAIVDSDDIEAITSLLANKSAQIREETLDQLIDKAPSISEWHSPLAERPKLPKGAAVRLAKFIADNLLAVLQERKDLTPEVAEEVSIVVNKRLDGSLKKPKMKKEELMARISEQYSKAKQMFADGILGENEIDEAIKANDDIFVAVAIAVITDIYPGTARKVFDSKDSTVISALAWKAGLSPEIAVELQAKTAGISKDKVLHPKEGQYPLSESHMDWQLILFIEESEKADAQETSDSEDEEN